MTLAPRLQSELNDYASYHRTFGNKVTHYAGIPMIVVSLLGLLAHLTLAGPLTAGIVLALVAWGYSLYLDLKVGVIFGIFLAASYLLGNALSSPILWTLFALGWIFQFIGHGVYEKKSPAFFTTVQHLIVGPIWVLCRGIRII